MHPEWPLILFTFFLCVAGGALGAQGLLNVMGKGKKMQLASLVTALAALVVGGLSVFMHLQHWERIFNGFGHITSGITLEFIGCIVFAVVLVLYFLMMRRAEDGMAPKWCGVLAIVVGLALPVITGMSYLMASLPSWNTPLLPVYYLANTVFMGGLTALVIAGLTNDDSAKDLGVKVALAGGALQLIAVFTYAFIINGSAGLYSADIQYYFDPTLPDVAMVDRASIVGSIFAGANAVMFWLGTGGRRPGCSAGADVACEEGGNRQEAGRVRGRRPGVRRRGRIVLARDPVRGGYQHLRFVLGDGRARSGRDSGRSWSERPNRLRRSARPVLLNRCDGRGFSNGTAPLLARQGSPVICLSSFCRTTKGPTLRSAVAPHLDAFARAPLVRSTLGRATRRYAAPQQTSLTDKDQWAKEET